MRQIALYVHIPFCKSKCPYCDFVSYEEYGMMTGYVDALKREIASHSESDSEIKSIFFGGGTPNLVSPELLETVFKTINSCFKVAPGAEISIEINPEFTDAEQFEHYLKMGINRISIGAQSFNDSFLKILGRIHDANQAIKAYEQARLAGFYNINMDLIYAIPEQTLCDWESDLNIIGSLNPEHVSAYPLTISKSCKWGKSRNSYKQDEDLTADMYDLACEYLPKMGLKQYEISNFSKNAFECKHNLVYWKREEYLGVGVGAHSLIDNMRCENTHSVPGYIEKIVKNQRTSTRKTMLSPEDIQSEIIFMNLRLNEGLNINEYEEKTGDNFFKSYQTQITSLLNDGMINLKGKKLSLTNKARPIANEVFCNFI